MATTALRSPLYRGRRIEAEVQVDTYQEAFRGTARVVDAGGAPQTPTAPSWRLYTQSNDATDMERHAGWVLVGDFVFFNDGTQVWLWDGDAASPLPSDPAMRLFGVSDGYSWDRSDCIHGVRALTTERELAATPPSWTCRLTVEAIGGAARIYVEDHGWRWLFPHAEGPRAALAQLRATGPADDLERLAAHLPEATMYERRLAHNHFFHRAHGKASDPEAEALDLERLPSPPQVDGALKEAAARVFVARPIEALQLEIKGWRPKSGVTDPDPARDEHWEATPMALAEALAGKHHGRRGYTAKVLFTTTKTLAGVEDLPDLEVLDASNLNDLEDISALAGLEGLRSLRLFLWGEAGKAIDYAPIAGLTGLQVLDLSGRGIADLQPLAGLTQLRRLDVSRCAEVASLTALAGLTALEELDIRQTAVRSLAPLHGLSSLRKLDPSSPELKSLDGAPEGWLAGLDALHLHGMRSLEDLGALRSATRLHTLALRLGCEPSKGRPPRLTQEGLAVLRDLPALRTLELREASGMNTLSGLTGARLEHLEFGVWGGTLDDLTAIGTLTGLRTLRLHLRPDADLRPLSALASLEELEITGDIRSLSGLEGCAALRSLQLRDTDNLVDLTPLAALGALERLMIDSPTRIASLEALRGLSKLKALTLYNAHEIADLAPLGGLAALEVIELGAGANVQDLSPLRDLPRVTSFSVACPNVRSLEGAPRSWLATTTSMDLNLPALTDLEPLAQAVRLERLTLRAPGLTTLAPLGGLPALRVLQVRDALLLETVDALLPGAALKELTLSGAPKLRSLAPLAALPTLEQLNTHTWDMEKRMPKDLPGSAGLEERLGPAWTR